MEFTLYKMFYKNFLDISKQISIKDVYYSFSPIIADYERENPIFREMIKICNNSNDFQPFHFELCRNEF